MEDEEVPLALSLEGEQDTHVNKNDAEVVEFEELAEPTTVPITIVTGFLGAGKTTLVRHILTADHGYRIAVILNEFGEELGIESSFVQSQEGLQRSDGEWIELTNGCMCCAVKSDFLQALESLLDRPPLDTATAISVSTPSRRSFDYILIETSGLANPGPIATALWTDTELESRVRLDGVVTVVDAINIDRQLHEPRMRGSVNEAQLQVAYADIVVLNKLDLVDEEALIRAEADIRAINSGVTVVRTQRSSVDLGLILNRNGYSQMGDLVLPPIEEADDEAERGDEGSTAVPGSPRKRNSYTGETPVRRRSSGVSCCSSRAHSFHSRVGAASAMATAAATAVAACDNVPAVPGSGRPGSWEPSPAALLSLTPLPTPPPSTTSLLATTGMAAQLPGMLTHASPARTNSIADHVHDNQVSTISLRCDHPVDLERFKSWVDHLLWDRDSRADEIYRMKGLLWVAGTDKKHMLQAVYELYEVISGPEWQLEEPRATRLVIIGRNLRPHAVKASWAEFVDEPPPHLLHPPLPLPPHQPLQPEP